MRLLNRLRNRILKQIDAGRNLSVHGKRQHQQQGQKYQRGKQQDKPAYPVRFGHSYLISGVHQLLKPRNRVVQVAVAHFPYPRVQQALITLQLRFARLAGSK